MTVDVRVAGWTRPHWALLVACMACIAYSWTPAEVGAPNERSRVYLAHALATRGSIDVSPEVEQWGVIYDIAKRDGRFYSDKAPGSSALAVPAVWVAARVADISDINALVQVTRDFVMLPAALLLALAQWRVLTLLGVSRDVRSVAVCALLLGSPILHYGHAFYGHALVAAAVAVTWVALLELLRTDGRRALAWAASAGLAAGSAFAIEYQAAFVPLALLLAIALQPRTRRPSLVAAVLLGMALPSLATLAYNTAAFGAPWSTSYDHLFHQRAADLHDSGIGGVTLPSLEGFVGVVLSPHRGLLFCAPAALLGVLGFRALWRRQPAAGVFAMVVYAGYAYVGLASSIWWGGWGFGPRLLVPLMVPGIVAFAFHVSEARESWAKGAAIALALGGVAYNLAVIPVWAEFPPRFHNPLLNVVPAVLERGVIPWNLGASLLDLEGTVSLVPLWLGALGVVLTAFVGVARRATRRQRLVGAAALMCWLAALVLSPPGTTERQAQEFAQSLPS